MSYQCKRFEVDFNKVQTFEDIILILENFKIEFKEEYEHQFKNIEFLLKEIK